MWQLRRLWPVSSVLENGKTLGKVFVAQIEANALGSKVGLGLQIHALGKLQLNGGLLNRNHDVRLCCPIVRILGAQPDFVVGVVVQGKFSVVIRNFSCCI